MQPHLIIIKIAINYPDLKSVMRYRQTTSHADTIWFPDIQLETLHDLCNPLLFTSLNIIWLSQELDFSLKSCHRRKGDFNFRFESWSYFKFMTLYCRQFCFWLMSDCFYTFNFFSLPGRNYPAQLYESGYQKRGLQLRSLAHPPRR